MNDARYFQPTRQKVKLRHRESRLVNNTDYSDGRILRLSAHPSDPCLLSTQINLLHFGIGPDFSGRTLCDHATVMQHGDPIS